MQEIRLWSLEKSDEGKLKAIQVKAIRNAETEQMLEDILVREPELLLPGLTLVGRQVPTKGGPLDLLGIDGDGRIVVFELKRGTLTRDTVTQAIDYASDLHEMEAESLFRHIEEYSGRYGINKIDDFEEVYNQNYPDSDALEEKPRIILVGLGADERALRMVNFLADSGLDIQILTFHAFERDGRLFLAKHVESTAPSPRVGAGVQRITKKDNYEMLFANAEQLGIKDLLERVRKYFKGNLPPAAYEWPGKESCSFYLPEKTERGNSAPRVYFSVYLRRHTPRKLRLMLNKRVVDAASKEIQEFQNQVPEATLNEKYDQVEVDFSMDQWDKLSSSLDSLVPAVERGWKAKVEESEEIESLASSEES